MEYQLLWKSRDEKKRSATDQAFLIILMLLSVLWIGIGIHGMYIHKNRLFSLVYHFDSYIRKYYSMTSIQVLLMAMVFPLN